MILADENIHSFVIKTLREAGHHVISVAEVAPAINDGKVIEMALQQDCLLLTEDKDFGEWVFAHHVKDLSVIFLRYSSGEYLDIAATLVRWLRTQIPERPFFATFTTRKVRIRKL